MGQFFNTSEICKTDPQIIRFVGLLQSFLFLYALMAFFCYFKSKIIDIAPVGGLALGESCF